MPCALLYHIEEPKKLQTLRFLLVKHGVKARVVAPRELCQPVGALCALEGFSPIAEESTADISDEMLVLCGFPPQTLDSLLSALRARRVSIALKAVVTEENAQWSLLRLHDELAREHEALHRPGK